MAQKGEVRTACFCSLKDFGARCFEQSGRGRECTVQENVKFPLLSCLSEYNELKKKCVCVGEMVKQEPKQNNI